MHKAFAWAALGLLTVSPLVAADVITDYTLDLGGGSSAPLAGLSARATFSIQDA